eukprot:TRINITY_DN5317_c0_g1_i1.p1 TRINITY_DN5317_c0_g1~~TRINITY_DN5317_c0_g1_i1.p1  ORF type:complete len:588 (-),score=161.29 TRINITY_DN5317_c0_g1_i1:353-2116(-)
MKRSSPLPETLVKLANDWIEWDPVESSKAEVQQWLSDANEEQLTASLSKRIAFGTAGLRGKMAAGFACMNELTVLQASQGVASYMLENVTDATSRGLALGYDGRYNSIAFARRTAATFLSKGFKVYMFDTVIPTPLVAFATTHYNCCVGIVITASHNPKEDNGYKVYAGNGCQIVSPMDKHITAAILANQTPWKYDQEALLASDLMTVANPEVNDKYFEVIKKFNYLPEDNKKSTLKVTYTAMHGVGTPSILRAFETYSLNAPILVKEQCDPNPDFPTVAFPNPEEGKGALALSFATADANDSPVVIANDPDADRLAAAEKLNGEWTVFTGDQIGILLAHWLFIRQRAAHPEVPAEKLLVLNTTVSSKMLKSFAETEGVRYEETHTGFKWLGTRAEELEKEGFVTLLAYEEAIGYMIGTTCLDKDGVRGAAVFAEMASSIYASGSTLFKHLDLLYTKYGTYHTQNKYFFHSNSADVAEVFKFIRNDSKYHETCGKFKISRIRDLTGAGYDSGTADKKPVLATTSSDMITIYFENGAVFTLRGSGTEPKLKYYIGAANITKEELAELVQSIITNLIQPEEHNLKYPSE